MIVNKIKGISAKWYYMAADLFVKGSMYLLTLIFSYAVLPEVYGNLSLFNSLVTLFFVIASMNLTSSFITRKRFDDDDDFSNIMSTVVTFLLIINVIFLILSYILLNNFTVIYSVPCNLILWSIIAAILTCYFDLLQRIFITDGNKMRYLLASIIYGILLIILSFLILFIFNNTGIYSIIYAKCLLLFCYSIYTIIYVKKTYNTNFKIDILILKEGLIFSIPLMLHSISGFILNYLDKFMINDIKNIIETAIYSFAYNLAMIMFVASLAVSKAFLPHFFQLLNEKNRDKINKYIDKDLTTLTTIFLLYVAVVGFIYPLFPTAYKSSILIFLMLSYNYLIFYGYTVYSNYLYYYKKTIKIFISTLISSLVNVILNYFLINKYGYFGATLSTVLSFLLLLIIYYIFAKSLDKNCYRIERFFVVFAIVGLILILYYIGYKHLIVRSLLLIIALALATKQIFNIKRQKE